MSSDLIVCFSSSCFQVCRQYSQAEARQHFKLTNSQHRGIKLKKCKEKCNNFNNTITSLIKPLMTLRQNFKSMTQQLITGIEELLQEMNEDIEIYSNQYYISKQSHKNIQSQMDNLSKSNISDLNCHKLDDILTTIDSVIKNKGFEMENKDKIVDIEEKLKKQFQYKLKQLFSRQAKRNESVLNLTEMIMAINQSSISGQRQEEESSCHSILADLNLDKASQVKFGKVKRQFKLIKKQEEKQDQYDTSASFKKKKQNNSSQDLQCSQSYFSLHSSPSTVLQQQSKLSGSLQSNQSSSSQDELSQQNDNKLNQTLQEIHLQVNKKSQPQSQSQFSAYFTIDELQRQKNEDKPFSIRVEINKIMYYSVLQGYIPKIKFIAGDKTGYGVFFTNFCQGMKVGTILDLKQCKIHHYKGSLEICNDNNFRIIKNNPSNIKANMKGVSINKVLIGDTLYYPLMDRRCALVRQVAEKLLLQSSFKVSRMIWSEDKERVFCLVGDSSGQMPAYLNKNTLHSIRQGDVVRLLKVMGHRGKQKGISQPKAEDILYLDTENQKSKVLRHGFDFLEVSRQVMTL